MREAASASLPVPGARPYHHGDLSRALVQAGRRILEAEGPNGLSLRAVAREAGVSPAAPYHHFKDKSELLEAIAKEGWMELNEAIAKARRETPVASDAMANIGLAYVCFARDNPALYRVMYRQARDSETMEEHAKSPESGWGQVREAIIAASGENDELELALATVAAWCLAHGIAEMAGFKEFEPLKSAIGGEEAFIRAVIQHVGVFVRPHRRA
ncbi:MAG: TetR/AcrR family transcriptional regulator [Caulobacteraceae bacterium]